MTENELQERKWREGTSLGMRLILEAIEMSKETNKKKIAHDLREYIYGPFLTWFKGDCTKHEYPPDLEL